jgi:SAM-dependent methyltransferase
MKPAHLAQHYGDQFQDQSIVDRYHKRPAYDERVFDVLTAQLPDHARILDVGCGTGEIAIPLAERGYVVTAVDPSAAMIEKAAQKSQQVDWHQAYAEAFHLPENLSLIVTANSLHWMDWPVVFPKFKQALRADGMLAVITGGELSDYAGQAEVMALVKTYSTNQDFTPFSVIELIEQGGFYKTERVVSTDPVPFHQPIADFVESIHARNGFSIERMGIEKAREFDAKVIEVLREHHATHVNGTLITTITFGRPKDDYSRKSSMAS